MRNDVGIYPQNSSRVCQNGGSASLKELLGEDRLLGILSKSVRVKETALERKPLHILAPESKWAQQIEEIAEAIERRVKKK
jgi:cellulose biosynthesis protein BcsQ